MVMQISSGSQPKQSGKAAYNVMNEKALPPHKADRKPVPVRGIVVALLVVAVVAFAAGSYLLKASLPTTTTSSTVSTTVQQQSSTTTVSAQSGLTGCTNITSPGSYSVGSKLKTGIIKGACINILSSNVRISCGGNLITGSGPFSAVPPFSYAIRVYKASNVSVVDCRVSNFSYGVAAFSSESLSVLGSNLSSNYMSNVYLNATTNSTILNNHLSRSLSDEGSVYLANGSVSNLVKNNTIAFDLIYGINVSSSNESFIDNRINVSNIASQYAFYCDPAHSYTVASTAQGNTCYNNYGCAFLTCGGQNLPANLSQVALPATITGCGAINRAGTYTLAHDINMGDYLNVNNPVSMNQTLPCIAIKSGSVDLNCNGHRIYNATYPIAAYNSTAVTISNCKVNNTKGYGIMMFSSPNSSVTNVVVTNARLGGILIQNSYFDNVTNGTFSRSGYGVVISNSQSDNLAGINSSDNTYGLYVVGSSIGNNFYRTTALNNSNIDVYSGDSVAGTGTQYVSGMTCGTTNAHWAPCRYVPGNASYVAVTSCMQIVYPGNYVMQGDLINARDNCVSIRASSVSFSCGSHAIYGNGPSSQGYGITVENVSGVSVENCTLIGFGQGGLYAYRTKNLFVKSVGVSSGSAGLVLNSTSSSSLLNNYVNGTSKYGILLQDTNSSNILYNQLAYGPSAVGIQLNSSRFNYLLNNTVSQYVYGIAFAGGSLNNTVLNNTVSVSQKSDYLCPGPESAINAEYGGIDYGSSKSGCGWMALIQRVSSTPPCTALTSPDTFSLSSDYIYPFGSICFTVLSNSSTINCNGHTILSTNGGTFVQVINGAHSVEVENCRLKGFTNGIEALYGSTEIYNNTIWSNASSGIGILVRGAEGGSILQNNVTGGGISFAVYNAVSEVLKNNIASISGTGYYIYNALAVQASYDVAGPTTFNGMVLNATTNGQFGSLTLTSKKVGLECIGSSKSSSTLVDNGGNSCSSNLNCSWIGSSSGTC
ncbi:MAG: right-handed parallel beta-helix repeat-containing protein [Candidatus Micrarchaeota archaeon]|nr:right-handed parallel beta-helix repeat-containing protein [Candidatus Micrarchaeota archaeon]